MKFGILFFLIAACACTMAPKYKRPESDAVFVEATNPTKEKISMISWEKLFTSPDLQRVINLALKHNRDLKIADLNIESARSQHGIARSDLMPTVIASGSETKQKAPPSFAAFTPKKIYRANLNTTSYEIDFFGRLQSLKKAAYEDFLASYEARNVTKISVIAETVNAYAQVLLDKKMLDLAKQTVVAQEEKYKISELRYQNGIDSKLTLLGNQAIYENAKIDYESYKKTAEQNKNALMILTGKFDAESLPKESELDEIKINEALLDFIPSETLLSRPDIQEAEHNLKSANANIGAARAAFFPSISLTGTYGYTSRDMSNLFSSRTWTFVPQINFPIFEGGKNIANLNLANAQKKVEILNYEKAIQNAFRETLDQLAQRESILNQLKSFDQILAARKKAYEISTKKREQGLGNKVEEYDVQITFLSAAQSRALSKKEYIVNLANLYKATGGGSELERIEE